MLKKKCLREIGRFLPKSIHRIPSSFKKLFGYVYFEKKTKFLGVYVSKKLFFSLNWVKLSTFNSSLGSDFF